MDRLFELFVTIMQQHIDKKEKVVLALSGGLDSRVMLDLLARFKTAHPYLHYQVVHVHHGLSPFAQQWAQFCQTWADEVGVDFYCERVQLTLSNNASVEQAARQARYQALAQYVCAQSLLLTAQHQTDQLETFLLAMKRGSGPKGLAAMPLYASFSDGHMLRPLLSIDRQAIREYAVAYGLEWIEDESNQDCRFDRNFIRHQITPILSERWPHIARAARRSAELCAQQELLLNELLTPIFQQLLAHDGSLNIALLSQQSPLARASLLRMWFDAAQLRMPSQKQLDHIWTQVILAQPDADPCLMLQNVQIRRYKGHLYQIVPAVDISQWSAKVEYGQACLLPQELGSVLINDTPSPWRLPTPAAGEKVWIHFQPSQLVAHPIERSKPRSLKKLFQQDYAVPSWLRRRLPILMYDDKVAAVLGVFICAGFQQLESASSKTGSAKAGNAIDKPWFVHWLPPSSQA